MLKLQPIPEIHQSRYDIHLILDKAHELQASPQSCVNILLRYSQQLGRIETSLNTMPLYHSPVLPGKACRKNIATVDQWNISSAQNFGLNHPSEVILHDQILPGSRQHIGGDLLILVVSIIALGYPEPNIRVCLRGFKS